MLDVIYAAGFDNPVSASQTVFRLLLNGISNPGEVADIPELGGVYPPALDTAAAAFLLAIADPETPVWFCDALRTDSVTQWMSFHCGSPVVDDPASAAFAVTTGANTDGALPRFALGEDRYPERSATVLVSCSSLEGGEPVTLSGPGLQFERSIAPAGLRDNFWGEARANHARFPLGVDLIFVAGSKFLCLPRSTQITAWQGAD